MTEPIQTIVVGQTAHVRWTTLYSEVVFLGDKTCAKALADVATQSETARALGYLPPHYGDNPAAIEHGVGLMGYEHDLFHTLLARMRDLDVSPTLWMVAHRHEDEAHYTDPANRAIRAHEEKEVLALQRWRRIGPIDGTVAALGAEFDLDRFLWMYKQATL